MGQLITNEDFTNVQQAQAGISKLFKKAAKNGRFYRVMRNNEALGVLIPNDLWESLVEDLEALSSSTYLRMIAESRDDKKRFTAKEVKKILKN
ncbi:type II toxin-antitoxin system Phd/YefM family antitoxin [Patescibacteria group bacterium]|nr:type II toxin-antitoxin system Phd/YefM family antitoxin [Patescibacteria group bacterium]MBU1868516.1 type II toxin-antitoxin system Phd/YefM family antitoxin [Patescibacteria group bacterium]